MPEVEKPSRSYTKLHTTLNVIACWAAIAASMWLGFQMASLVVPMMVTLIAALLGVYQTVGHFDLRALTHNRSKANRPRDKPTEPQS